MAAVGFICSCGPTQPGSGNTQPPSLTAIADWTVFVGEPIDFRVVATDPEGDAITFSLPGAPGNASLDPSSGLFSWRPALADTGEKTIPFQASDGAHNVATSTTFTVIMPALTDSEAVRFLRPVGEETYTYGDTLTIAFAIKWCCENAFIEVHTRDQNTLAQAIDMPARDVTDFTDSQGRVCRFARPFPDRMMWIGYYKFPLVDQVTMIGDTLRLGGGTARVDSVRIRVFDPYVDLRGPAGCASTIPVGFQVMNDIMVGVYSGYFSVAPRP
jgi:hypothetical protein